MTHEHGHHPAPQQDLSRMGVIAGIILLIIACILLREFFWGIICLVVGLNLLNRYFAQK